MRALVCVVCVLMGCTKASEEHQEPKPKPVADAAVGASRARPAKQTFADLKGWRMLPWKIGLSEAKKKLTAAGLSFEVDMRRGSYYERRPLSKKVPGSKYQPRPHRIRHRFTHILTLGDGFKLRFTNHKLASAVRRGPNIPERRRAERALEAISARWGPHHRTQTVGAFEARVWQNAHTRLIAYVVTDRSRPGLVTHWLIERWEPS